MKIQIIKELEKLEKELNVTVLYAVESGSRAWGFASTDSDWDVRFIYMHNMDWYLSINDKKDSYNKILANDIDLSGWELKKTLNLFKKSNPPLMEWLESPIIYYQNSSVIEKLRKLSKKYFNPKSCMYHYLHMAEGNYREYLKSDTVRIKKYFYVLRPILACSWIEQTGKMAPMEFHKLVDTQVKDPVLKKEIERLLVRKMNGEELDLEPRVAVLNDFIEEKIEYYKNYLPGSVVVDKVGFDELNEFFRGVLGGGS